MNIDETIDSFRNAAVDLDCKKMVLSQRKAGGGRFEGQGYIRQISDGSLTFKLYVTTFENAAPLDNLKALHGPGAGKLLTDEAYYDLTALARDGTTWSASSILPKFNWDMTDNSVLANGQILSIVANLMPAQPNYCLRLHFFEEYEVPLHVMSQVEEHGSTYSMLDRAEFEACGSKFEVRKREGSGDTVVEATRDTAFPPAFTLRVQEALQYLIGKTATWRARVATEGDGLVLELASPQRKSPRTQFNPPISPTSIEFRTHGWVLFASYLAYLVESGADTQWSPIAYHLYNARESTANSIDARAIGVSVAVEAIASLAQISTDEEKAKKTVLFQKYMRECLAAQSGFEDFVPRMDGLITMLGNKRPQDTLHDLAKAGYVEKSYIKSWQDLRNRHVHPTIKDLKKPNLNDYQKLLDNIHRVEVLLHQLTFYLIEYKGSFTDYGTENFPLKQYPLGKADDVNACPQEAH